MRLPQKGHAMTSLFLDKYLSFFSKTRNIGNKKVAPT